jgi:hypothetical protein
VTDCCTVPPPSQAKSLISTHHSSAACPLPGAGNAAKPPAPVLQQLQPPLKDQESQPFDSNVSPTRHLHIQEPGRKADCTTNTNPTTTTEDREGAHPPPPLMKRPRKTTTITRRQREKHGGDNISFSRNDVYDTHGDLH